MSLQNCRAPSEVSFPFSFSIFYGFFIWNSDVIIWWLAGVVMISVLWVSWILFAMQCLFTFRGAQWNCWWISQMGIQSDFDCSYQVWSVLFLKSMYFFVYGMLKWEYNQILISLYLTYQVYSSLNQCISLFYNFNFMFPLAQ